MKAASHIFSFTKVPAALSRYRLHFLFAQQDQAAKSEVKEEGNLFLQVWKIIIIKKLQSWFSMCLRDGWEWLLQWGWFMNERISISNWKCVRKWDFKSIKKQIRASFNFFMMVVYVVCSWAADAQRSWNVYGFVLKCLCAYIHTCWSPPSPTLFNNHSTH